MVYAMRSIRIMLNEQTDFRKFKKIALYSAIFFALALEHARIFGRCRANWQFAQRKTSSLTNLQIASLVIFFSQRGTKNNFFDVVSP
jgi:hypothetical protein